MSMVRPLIAGNWKMNGMNGDLAELRAIASGLSSDLGRGFDALVCVPATLLSRASGILQGESLLLGGQDCHFAASGAYTGDVSALMLKDAGAQFVILGHSERRGTHHESDALVSRKMQAAFDAGLQVILCVGESLNEREAGEALARIGSQLDGVLASVADPARLTVAYEPIWAIGTGRISSLEDIGVMHHFIRTRLCEHFGEAGRRVRLLYGGSVKPDNAAQIMALDNVNGALVGGASLKAQDFIAICSAKKP